MPEPVQIAMPRRKKCARYGRPANCAAVCQRRMQGATGGASAHLHLARVQELGRVIDEPARPVALDTGDDVVRVARDALGDDAEAVVLARRTAADAPEQSLLDTLLELDDRDTGRGRRDLDGHLADGEPGDADPARAS